MANWEATFVAALKAGAETRRRAFDFWEQEHGHRFGKGEAGMKLYEDLLAVVRKAGSEEAVKEYQNRFVPLLDQQLLGQNVMGAFLASLDERMEALHEKVRKGGDEGLRTFFAIARTEYGGSEDVDALMKWALRGFAMLPKDEQEIVVAMGVEAVLKQASTSSPFDPGNG